MTRILSVAAALAVVVGSVGIFASPALAHETRSVGPYTFVVGWVTEPAIVGQANALFLGVSETASGMGVEGLAKTLTAQVIAGGGAATKSLGLSADADMPGQYTSDLVPTRAGDYTFRFTGTVGTTKIDEKFESGPNRFDPVTNGADLQFPDQVPPAGELAKQLADANTKVTIAMALAAVAVVVSFASFIPALRRR